jgi:MFS family permease
LTDMLGRRWIAVLGSLLLVVASIVLAFTETLGSAVTAQAIGGVGAWICELTALAGYDQTLQVVSTTDV